MAALISVLALTFVVHFIGTIAFSPRVAGVLTGRISLSTSFSNILNIISRSASVLMIPILSKKIEVQLGNAGSAANALPEYFFILSAALLASLAGLLCFKWAVRVLYYAVAAYTPAHNILFLLLKAVVHFNQSAVAPAPQQTTLSKTDYKYLVSNTLVTCIYTSATLAAIYSAYYVPQYRVTSLSYAFIINGIATVIYTTIIDPYVASLTDNAVAHREVIPQFYYRIRCFIYSRIAGVVLSLITFRLFIGIISYWVSLRQFS